MAPIAKIRMCSSWSAAVDRRRASARRALRELLQPSSSSQRDWICDTAGQAGGARGTNLCRARSQTGRRAAAATDPPPGRVGKTEYRWRLVGPAAKLIAPGETEAGSAGKQPCRGITRWAHRDDEVGACEHCSAPPYHSSADLIRAIDPDALKILARRAKHLCLTKNGDSPFPAEPEQFPSVVSSERSRVDNKMTGQTTGGIQMLECSPPREGRKGSPGKETVGFLPLVRQRIMAGQPLPSAAGTNLRSKSKFQISLVRIRVLKTMVELRRINFRHQRR